MTTTSRGGSVSSHRRLVGTLQYACLPALRRHFSLPAHEPASLPQGGGKLRRARLAAIGTDDDGVSAGGARVGSGSGGRVAECRVSCRRK